MKNQREGGFLIAKIHQLSGRILARKLKEYNLDEINPAQGRILFALWRSDEISIQELAKKTSLGKSTLTSMLDRLEKAGYLTRIPSRKDRRKILVKLTEKDKKLQNVYLQVSREMTELFYHEFTAKEIDEFETYLRRIFGNLTALETKTNEHEKSGSKAGSRRTHAGRGSKKMVKKKHGRFNGFSRETLDFLRNLEVNNNKVWFEAHKQDYQKYLLEPLRNLVRDMGEFMLAIDPWFEVRPAVNKTISRIYRDTRFSRDKSPYKNTMWITFKRPGKNWRDAPAYFFEISPDSYRYGMGFYSASKDTMDRFRETIDKKPKEFLKAISFYPQQQDFVVEGEEYKRILDENKPEEVQNWYQRRNLYLVCNRKIDNRLFSRELIDDLIFGFGLLAPFYHYLWRIKFGGKTGTDYL